MAKRRKLQPAPSAQSASRTPPAAAARGHWRVSSHSCVPATSCPPHHTPSAPPGSSLLPTGTAAPAHWSPSAYLQQPRLRCMQLPSAPRPPASSEVAIMCLTAPLATRLSILPPILHTRPNRGGRQAGVAAELDGANGVSALTQAQAGAARWPRHWGSARAARRAALVAEPPRAPAASAERVATCAAPRRGQRARRGPRVAARC